MRNATIFGSRLIALLLVAAGLTMFVPAHARAQEEAATDTTDDEGLVADSDSTDVPEPAWTVTVNPLYDSRTVRNGTEMTDGGGSLATTLSVAHSAGWSAGLSTLNLVDSAGRLQQWAGDLGYAGKISEVLGYSVAYSRTTYANDSVSAVADMPNALAFGLSFDAGAVNINLLWDHAFGGSVANFFSVELSSLQQSGRWSFLPNFGAVFGSQTIAVKRLVYVRLAKKAKQGPKVIARSILKPVRVRGLTEVSADIDISYDLGGGFKLMFEPAFSYTPIGELALERTHVAWTAGVMYEVGL